MFKRKYLVSDVVNDTETTEKSGKKTYDDTLEKGSIDTPKPSPTGNGEIVIGGDMVRIEKQFTP